MRSTLRYLIISLTLILCLSMAVGCAGQAAESLYDRGMELIKSMAEMAKSEDYLAIMTGNSALTEALASVQAGSYGTPEAVYTIPLKPSYLEEMAEGAAMPALTDSLKDVIKDKTAGAFISQINALAGAQNLAAASVVAAGTTFMDGTVAEPVVYLYIFADGAPAAVTFIPGEGGAVSASGMFLLYDGVDYHSREDVQNFFDGLGVEIAALSK